MFLWFVSSDKRFILSFSLFLITLTAAPYVYGWMLYRGAFSGITYLSPADGSVYLGYLKQAMQGRFLFENLFTVEPQSAQLMLFWLPVGVLARLVGNAPLAMHIARILLIPILVWTLMWAYGYFFSALDGQIRRILVAASFFFSGAGWISTFWMNAVTVDTPIDLWVTESGNFMTILQYPHFIISLTLLVAAIVLGALALERNSMRYAWGAGACCALLIIGHPFHTVSVGAVLAAFACIYINRGWMRASRVMVLAVPVAFGMLLPTAWYAYQLHGDATLAAKAAQNLCLMPPLHIALLSYGLLLPLAVYGAARLVRAYGMRREFVLLFAWTIVQAMALYAPVSFGRRLSEGLQVPLIGLAAYGVYVFAKEVARGRVVALIILLSLSPLVAYGRTIEAVRLPSLLTATSTDLRSFATWYETHARSDDVLIAPPILGNVIPGMTGRRVVVGHGVETIDFIKKLATLNEFMRGSMDDAAAAAYMKKSGATWLLIEEGSRVQQYVSTRTPYKRFGTLMLYTVATEQ